MLLAAAKEAARQESLRCRLEVQLGILMHGLMRQSRQEPGRIGHERRHDL